MKGQKKIFIKKSVFYVLIILLLSFQNTFGQQLHTIPTGANGVFNWSETPNNINAFDWVDSSLSQTYTDVNGTGVDMVFTFTGRTDTFGNWTTNMPLSFNQSPEVTDLPVTSTYPSEALTFFTDGIGSADDITLTITFSRPIDAIGFDLLHINKSSGNNGGDRYFVTGEDGIGNTIYPTFTNSSLSSYTSNNATGEINSVGSLGSGQKPQIGVNFSDSDKITSITIVWQNCTSCSSFAMHGGGLSGFNFLAPIADLSLIKTVDNALPKVGDNITYTLTIENSGPFPATNVQVTDIIPTELNNVLVNAPPTTSYSGNIWDVGTLAIGSKLELKITGEVGSPGVIVNTGKITRANEFDPDSDPNN